jgi:hypothetical protein
MPVVLALVTACSSANLPVAPIGTNNPVTSVPAPTPTPIVPGLGAHAGTYVFMDTGVKVASWTQRSRFVLGDDGRFALQYEGIAEYRGTYSYSDATGTLTFEWEGWSTAGPWGATASVRDDVLTVSFNVVMQLSDFENARYRRVP